MSYANTRAATQDVAALVGRVLLSLIFLWAGFGKLVAFTATAAYFAKDGLPVPLLAAGVAVVIELGGGLMILFGAATVPVALVMAAWCIATALIAHTDFANMDMKIHFMKNVAMTGGFLYVAGFGAGAYSLDAVVRRRPLTSAA